MNAAKHLDGKIPPNMIANMTKSKSKKLMKTNQSTTGIMKMVSHLTNVVGYSNVMPFLEHDAVNLNSDINGIIARRHNKDTFGKKHCCTIDNENIPIDGNDLNSDNKSNINDGNDHGDNDDDTDDETDAYIEAETDSLASIETLSDNVAIWVDGERHSVSGVDENTTCMDLICALINYQNAQQMPDHNTNDHYHQDNLDLNLHRNDYDFTIEGRSSKGTNSTNMNGFIDGNNAINQSMPTKSGKQEALPSDISSMKAATLLFERNVVRASEYVIVKKHRHFEEYLDGNAKVFDVLLPAKSEGVLSSAMGIGGVSNRKECELFLRRLVSSATMSMEAHHVVATSSSSSAQHAGNTQVASLLSTDKDSGMGSPVGSSRSARFRRRKHKSATWLSQSNTLHPKATQRSGASGYNIANNNCENIANERLMRIILAQDETIHRQLSMLREKERQICKIEEEKHRVRERELGKNYLLETYFKGLDEAVREPDKDGDEEIFIDETYRRVCENVETVANAGISQQCSSRFNKKVSNSQQHSNESGNNISSDVVKANKSAPSNIETGRTIGDATVTASIAADGVAADVGNQNEIEMQIFWLEKVYALNKQLQREEETLLKLHAKIRKHQVRYAYQMKNDVLEQIDELDGKLALQCADICRVEDSLVISNEELRGKLNILENLNVELQEVQPRNASIDASNIKGIRNCDQQSKLLNNDVNLKSDALEMKSRKRKPNLAGTKQKCKSNTNQTSLNCPVENDHNVVSNDDEDDSDDDDDDDDGDDEYVNDVDKIVDDDGCMETRGKSVMTIRKTKMQDDVVDTVTLTTAVVSPMTTMAFSTSVMHSSSLSQQQMQQEQNSNIIPHKKQQKHIHNYPTMRVNQLDKCTLNSNSDNPMITIHPSANVISKPTTNESDKNIHRHQSKNVNFIKKPMFEAFSTTIDAVKCQQQRPGCSPTTLIDTPTFALKDSSAASDLSRLGTLV